MSIATSISPKRAFSILYIANFVLSLQYALIIYINSSYLTRYLGSQSVGLIYTIASILTLILFLNVPRALRLAGNLKLVMVAVTAQCAALVGLSLSPSLPWVIAAFVIQEASVYIAYLSLDIFLESSVKNERRTGSIRTAYFTMANLAIMIAPSIVGFLTARGTELSTVYLISASLSLPIAAALGFGFLKFKDSKYSNIKIKSTAADIASERDIRNVFATKFLLTSFYAVMVIYTPLYLHNQLGMSWAVIGPLFTIMLLPFVVFEIPVGALADAKFGEKEFMLAGFVVMGLSTAAISYVPASASLAIWAGVLFLTRAGASVVEAATESYFFKHVKGRNANLISFFRMTSPLSYVVAPLAVGAMLKFTDYRHVFLALGLFMLTGIWFSLRLKDTR